jgi:hypothetical protein
MSFKYVPFLLALPFPSACSFRGADFSEHFGKNEVARKACFTVVD